MMKTKKQIIKFLKKEAENWKYMPHYSHFNGQDIAKELKRLIAKISE